MKYFFIQMQDIAEREQRYTRPNEKKEGTQQQPFLVRDAPWHQQVS